MKMKFQVISPRKVLFWTAWTLTSVIYILGFLTGCFFYRPFVGYGKMKEIFIEDYGLLETVAHGLAETGDIYIYSTLDIDMNPGFNTSEEITDDSVLAAINELMTERGYSAITKDGQTISFRRWSIKDSSSGIAYSADGSELQIDFLTRVEPLSEENWYYFESFYNVWKGRNTITDILVGNLDSRWYS